MKKKFLWLFLSQIEVIFFFLLIENLLEEKKIVWKGINSGKVSFSLGLEGYKLTELVKKEERASRMLFLRSIKL